MRPMGRPVLRLDRSSEAFVAALRVRSVPRVVARRLGRRRGGVHEPGGRWDALLSGPGTVFWLPPRQPREGGPVPGAAPGQVDLRVYLRVVAPGRPRPAGARPRPARARAQERSTASDPPLVLAADTARLAERVRHHARWEGSAPPPLPAAVAVASSAATGAAAPGRPVPPATAPPGGERPAIVLRRPPAQGPAMAAAAPVEAARPAPETPSERSRLTPGPGGGRAGAAPLTAADLPVVVDRVVREIDRRVVAARERRGWTS
jgi:hypothetical protein